MKKEAKAPSLRKIIFWWSFSLLAVFVILHNAVYSFSGKEDSIFFILAMAAAVIFGALVISDAMYLIQKALGITNKTRYNK